MEPITPGEATRIATALRAGFVTQYSQPALHVARAPGRVNLIGEHTDYNGGLCLPLALPHATYVAFAPRDDDQVRVRSLGIGTWSGSLTDLATAPGWAGYVTGTLWALGIERGADLLIDSRVPAGSGLSSSAALTCAVASAVRPDLLTDVGRPRLAAAAMWAEREVVGAPTGGLDQTIAMLAPAHGALLLDFGRPDAAGTPAVTPVPVQLGGHHLLVVDSGVRHDLAAGGYAERRDECQRAATELGVDLLSEATADAAAALNDPVLRRRAQHVVSENQRVRDVVAAWSAGDLATVGELLTASHLSLRDDFEVSCPELDLLVATAIEAGAAGARMTGGGFGGAAVLLVPDEHTDRILAALDAAWRAQGWRGLSLLDTGGGAPRAGLVAG